MTDTTAMDCSVVLPFESTQARVLMMLIESTLDKIAENVSVKDFRKIMENLDTLKKRNSKICRIRSVLNQLIKRRVMSDLQECLRTDGLDNQFCKLNEIVSSSSLNEGEVAWRPSRNASQDLNAHVVNLKLKQKSYLEQLVKEKTISVQKLKEKVVSLRRKAKEVNTEILKRKDELSASNKTLKEELQNDICN